MWGIHPSDWWDWLTALDWSQLNNVLSSIVAVIGIAGIFWAAVKFLWNPLFDRLSRRRAQAKLLNQLACGSSVEFVERLCGTAQFVTMKDGHEQRTYRLAGAWVMIEVEDNAVLLFNITITSKWMHFNTQRLTFGHLKVELGKDSFADTQADFGFKGENLWWGANRRGYLRYFYFGNPGGYQHYWLSYNESGTGKFNLADWSKGIVMTGEYAQVEVPWTRTTETVDTTGITVNTLTVLAPHQSADTYMKRTVLGPDRDQTRLVRTLKHPPWQTKRARLKSRFDWLKVATQHRFRRD